jgi:clan AA aspartic protease (TIGR02281 family)
LPSLSPSRIRGRRAFGGVLFVPIRLWRQTFDFLVDTGAAYSAISPALASVFNLTATLQGAITIAPAHGTPVSVPRVILPEISVGGIRLTDVEALVVEFPSALRLDGLLGMNILGQFRVTLECDTSTLVLRPV